VGGHQSYLQEGARSRSRRLRAGDRAGHNPSRPPLSFTRRRHATARGASRKPGGRHRMAAARPVPLAQERCGERDRPSPEVARQRNPISAAVEVQATDPAM
jgi:hypothetical protein